MSKDTPAPVSISSSAASEPWTNLDPITSRGGHWLRCDARLKIPAKGQAVLSFAPAVAVRMGLAPGTKCRLGCSSARIGLVVAADGPFVVRAGYGHSAAAVRIVSHALRRTVPDGVSVAHYRLRQGIVNRGEPVWILEPTGTKL